MAWMVTLGYGYTSPGEHKHTSGLTKQVEASVKYDVFKEESVCEGVHVNRKDTRYF